MKFFNLAKDGVPELVINRNIDEFKANEISEELFNTLSDKVRITLNTFGGNLKAGLQILTAMQAFQASGGIIETINGGVADSVGSWLLSAGTKGYRKAFEFARVLIHEPLIDNGGKMISISQLPEGDTKDQLNEFFNSIILILSRTTGMNKSTLRSLMKKETRFTGKEMVTNGFVDELIKVNNAPKIAKNENAESIIEIVNNSNFNIIENQKTSTMKKELAVFLGLDPEASDSAFVNAVKTAIEDKVTLTEANAALTTKVGEKDTSIVNLNAEVAEFKATENESMIATAIKEGKIEESKKEEIVNLGKEKGFDFVKTMLESMPKSPIKKAANIADGLKEKGTDAKSNVMQEAVNYFKGDMKDETLEASYKEVCNTTEFQKLITKTVE